MRELVSGTLLGLVLVVAGVALFRNRRRIVDQNYEMRRNGVFGFVAKGMKGGDQIMFPVMAFVIAGAGVALALWSIYGFLAGRY